MISLLLFVWRQFRAVLFQSDIRVDVCCFNCIDARPHSFQMLSANDKVLGG